MRNGPLPDQAWVRARIRAKIMLGRSLETTVELSRCPSNTERCNRLRSFRFRSGSRVHCRQLRFHSSEISAHAAAAAVVATITGNGARPYTAASGPGSVALERDVLCRPLIVKPRDAQLCLLEPRTDTIGYSSGIRPRPAAVETVVRYWLMDKSHCARPHYRASISYVLFRRCMLIGNKEASGSP